MHFFDHNIYQMLDKKAISIVNYVKKKYRSI